MSSPLSDDAAVEKRRRANSRTRVRLWLATWTLHATALMLLGLRPEIVERAAAQRGTGFLVAALTLSLAIALRWRLTSKSVLASIQTPREMQRERWRVSRGTRKLACIWALGSTASWAGAAGSATVGPEVGLPIWVISGLLLVVTPPKLLPDGF